MAALAGWGRRAVGARGGAERSRAGELGCCAGLGLQGTRGGPSAPRRPVGVGARGASGWGGGGGAGEGEGGERHLLVMVHGLFGRPRDWRHVVTELHRAGAVGHRTGVRVLLSSANQRTRTFDGVDRCGERLAREISAEVSANPELSSVSLVGHSLGGLIARYAAGILLEGSGPTATVARLRPELFCTIVTPHLGCDPPRPASRGETRGPTGDTVVAVEARVPFLEWVGRARGLGPPLQSLASVAAAPASSIFLGRTGAQLFLRDRGQQGGGRPLLVEMADGRGGAPAGAEGGSSFWRALSAFRARVAYSNVQGDHMVGWPNASLRRCSELPREAQGAARPAIVLDTPPARPSERRRSPKGVREGDTGAEAEGAHLERISEEEHLRDEMLRGLQDLEWRRVDVSLEAQLARLPPAVPHNHIQARPPTEAGLLTTRHLAGVLRETLRPRGGVGRGDGASGAGWAPP